jgi:lipoprotein NlpI
VVLLFVLSIFAVSVPIGASFARISKEGFGVEGAKVTLSDILDHVGWETVDHSIRGTGSLPDPKNAYQYAKRGAAYARNGHFDRAIADYTKAIEIDPNDSGVLTFRGYAYELKGDFDSAIADFTKAIEINSQNSVPFRGRGFAKYAKADFQGAATDLLRAAELKEDDIYPVLIRYVARTRAGETTAAAELETNAGRLKTSEWPYAVVELYLGKRSAAATLEAVPNPEYRCDALYFIGQWHIVKGDTAEAVKTLETAAVACPRTMIEHQLTLAELKRLKQ